MHTREMFGSGWWRSATVGGRLALWLGIALLFVVPLPSQSGAAGLAVALAARQHDQVGLHSAGDAFRLQGHAHPPARTIAPQAADSTLSGTVVNADGSPFNSTGSPNTAAGITAISFDGTYSFANLASDGSFSIALEAGMYEVSVWLDSMVYPSIGGPQPFYVSVSGVTPIGNIALVNRSVTVSGSVNVFSSPAVGVPISAWNAQGEQFSTTTNGAGHYSLALTPGNWQISPDLLYTTSYIYAGAPEIRQLGAGQVATINFGVEQPAGTITGSVINQNTNTTVTNSVGWAYVTRNGGEVLKWAPISNGSFSLPTPSANTGDVLRVGLYLDPNSAYSNPGETALNNSAGPNFSVNIPVQPHDATIAGHIYLAGDASHAPVTQVNGQVVLTALDDHAGTPITKSTPIDPATGRYSVDVPPGNWLVTYQIITDTYQADLSSPLSVAAMSQQISILDLPLTSLDGFVTVEVRDQEGVPQPNITVWVRYGTQEVYGETDAQGQATVYVPYSSSGLRTGAISPQGQQQPPLTIGTSYSSCKKPLKPDKSPPISDPKCKNSSLVVAKVSNPKPKPGGLISAAAIDPPVALSLRDTNSMLTGRVLDAGGQTTRADAFVSAWSANGQWISGATDANGAFSLPIVQDSTISTTWQISASYWDSSAKKLLSKRVSTSTPIGQAPTTPIAAGDLALEQITSVPPPSESQHFNNSAGLTLPLSDGTLIQIPKNAMPDGFGTDIRITVDPQIALPSTDLNRLAVYYGYTINLYDAQTGKPIEQPLKQPATITFSYTPAQLQQLGISEDDLQPAQFADDTWHVAEGFLQDKQGMSKTISLKTTTLDNWALVVEQPVVAQVGGAHVYMPLVAR